MVDGLIQENLFMDKKTLLKGVACFLSGYFIANYTQVDKATDQLLPNTAQNPIVHTQYIQALTTSNNDFQNDSYDNKIQTIVCDLGEDNQTVEATTDIQKFVRSLGIEVSIAELDALIAEEKIYSIIEDKLTFSNVDGIENMIQTANYLESLGLHVNPEFIDNLIEESIHKSPEEQILMLQMLIDYTGRDESIANNDMLETIVAGVMDASRNYDAKVRFEALNTLSSAIDNVDELKTAANIFINDPDEKIRHQALDLLKSIENY